MDQALSGVRPFWIKLLHLLPSSMSHRLGIAFLKNGLLLPTLKGFFEIPKDERLVTELAGVKIDNPLGLAAGYDKDGLLYPSLGMIGLGFYTIGSVTLMPRSGNRKKVLKRLEEELGLINSLGIPSKGIQFVNSYLRNLKKEGSPIILNVAPTTSKELYILLNVAEKIGAVKFIEVNISCPNNFENMQVWEALEAIRKPKKPVFIKLGPDHIGEIGRIVDVCEREGLGLTVLNTLRAKEGGVSGLPLYPYTIKAVKEIRKVSRKVPIIATGGVLTGKQAFELIKAGADAIGILTAIVYRGPSAFKRIAEELLQELIREGFEDLKQVREYS